MGLLDTFLMNERQRRDGHRQRLICWEARWDRVKQGLYEGELTGDFGRMIAREIETRFARGAEDDKGEGVRWKQMKNSLDVSFHLMHRLVDQLAMIHRRPLEVTGALGDSKVWRIARRKCNLDAVLQTKLEYCLALGSCGVRPKLVAGHPPGLVVVPPHMLTVFPTPYNDMEAMIVIEHSSNEAITVYDMSDPSNPRWEGWPSLAAWSASKDGVYGYSPTWEMSGEDYPWTYQGVPRLPWVFYQGTPTPTCILPQSKGLVQDTLDVILQRTWFQWVGYVGSFDRVAVVSDRPLDGFDQASIDPAVILNLFGPGERKTFHTIPNATEAVKRLWEVHSDRVEEMASRYNSGVQVKRSASAKSGAAIQLELSGLWQQRAQQETQHRDLDKALIEIEVATWNYLVRSGMMKAEQLPESEFELRYPTAWTADEKQVLLEAMSKSVAEGLYSPVDLYLLQNDLPDNKRNRRLALRALVERGQERKQVVLAGLLVPAEKLLPMPEPPAVSPGLPPADAPEPAPGKDQKKVKSKPAVEPDQKKPV